MQCQSYFGRVHLCESALSKFSVVYSALGCFEIAVSGSAPRERGSPERRANRPERTNGCSLKREEEDQWSPFSSVEESTTAKTGTAPTHGHRTVPGTMTDGRNRG